MRGWLLTLLTVPEPDWLKDAADEYKWFPNNTVQYIEYEPEVERYGGDTCILVAERQFELCSDTILALTSESDTWDYNRALGAAIQLHLGFAFGTGMSLDGATQFFQRIFQSWLPRAYYFYEKDISQEVLEARREETLKAFEENWKAQQGTILPFVETVWDALP